jgi:hypothetical protein
MGSFSPGTFFCPEPPALKPARADARAVNNEKRYNSPQRFSENAITSDPAGSFAPGFRPKQNHSRL